MGHTHEAVEAAKTVLEVADYAWSALEHHHHHKNPNQENLSAKQLDDLRKENRILRDLLENNLKLLHNLSAFPCFLDDCPPNLHECLVAAVDSKSFLSHLQSLHNGSVNGTGNEFPFNEPTGADLDSVQILINEDQENPSWWVWVTDDMVPSTTEECSGIDNESYVVVCEEHVVDGVANFIANCIISNPKAQKLTPEQLQKTVTKSLGGINKVEKMLSIWHAGKMFYALSTWGLAVAGLYQGRAGLKLAARGVHTAGKLVLKAI